MSYAQIKKAWNQDKIPVVVRTNKKGSKLHVRIPGGETERRWINSIGKSSGIWIGDKRYWQLPKTWFNDFVNRALDRYRQLYVIQPYRVLEKCAPACQNATGHICQCSCMGAHHGAGNDGSWFEVTDAFSGRWGEEELACRLMKAKDGASPFETIVRNVLDKRQ